VKQAWQRILSGMRPWGKEWSREEVSDGWTRRTWLSPAVFRWTPSLPGLNTDEAEAEAEETAVSNPEAEREEANEVRGAEAEEAAVEIDPEVGEEEEAEAEAILTTSR
jgi:hypothetical protein